MPPVIIPISPERIWTSESPSVSAAECSAKASSRRLRSSTLRRRPRALPGIMTYLARSLSNPAVTAVEEVRPLVTGDLEWEIRVVERSKTGVSMASDNSKASRTKS